VRAVNLIPRENTRSSGGPPKPAVLAAAIAGAAVVGIIGGGNLIQTARVSSAQKTLNAAKIQLAATPLPPKVPRVAPPPPAVAQQMQPRLQAVTVALSTRIAWDRLLREFSLVLPSDIQLNTLTLTQPAAATASSQGLSLAGVTYSYDGVARLLARMSLIPDLTDVSLKSSSIAQGVVSFTIGANVKGAPAPVLPVVAPPVGGTTTTTPGTSS
jgi:Tfp pilus assembly protein PilN